MKTVEHDGNTYELVGEPNPVDCKGCQFMGDRGCTAPLSALDPAGYCIGMWRLKLDVPEWEAALNPNG